MFLSGAWPSPKQIDLTTYLPEEYGYAIILASWIGSAKKDTLLIVLDNGSILLVFFLP